MLATGVYALLIAAAINAAYMQAPEIRVGDAPFGWFLAAAPAWLLGSLLLVAAIVGMGASGVVASALLALQAAVGALCLAWPWPTPPSPPPAPEVNLIVVIDVGLLLAMTLVVALWRGHWLAWGEGLVLALLGAGALIPISSLLNLGPEEQFGLGVGLGLLAAASGWAVGSLTWGRGGLRHAASGA